MSAFMSNGSGGVTICRPEEAADHLKRLQGRGHKVRIETPAKDEVKLYWGSMAARHVPNPIFDEILADIAAGKYAR